MNTTHMVLSLRSYFPLRIHCNERDRIYACNTEACLSKSSCKGVTDQLAHVTKRPCIVCDQHNTCYPGSEPHSNDEEHYI